MDSTTMMHLANAVCATVAVLLGCCTAAFAQMAIIKQTCDSMARQPDLASDLRTTMIVGLAMIESLAIYCLLIALVLLFAKW